MKRLSLIAVALVAPLCAQINIEEQDLYESGLIVLRDQRVVAIRGDFEILGDEVHFMDTRGERMVLPLDRIDLDETRRRNDEIREKNTRNRELSNVNDGSLYGAIQQHKLQQEQDESKGILVQGTTDVAGERAPAASTNTASGSIQERMEDALRQIPGGNEELVQRAEGYMRKLETRAWLMWVLLIGAILIGILKLTSFFTCLYLIYDAFSTEGFLWGMALLTAVLGIPIASIAIQNMVMAVLQLVGFFVVPLYILLTCQGRRKGLFLLWGLVYIFAVVYLGVIVLGVVF